MDIEQLITNGQHKLDLQADAERIAKEVEDRKAEESRLALVSRFVADATNATPEPLRPYLDFGEVREREPGYDEKVFIRVPECSAIFFEMRRGYDDKGYFWNQVGNAFYVHTATDLYKDWNGEDSYTFRVSYNNQRTTDIEITLALARGASQSERDLVKKAYDLNAQDAERERQLQEHDNGVRIEQAQRESDEIAELAAQLSADEFTLHLARAFVSITRERATWQDKLDGALEATSEAEYHYERQLERANESTRKAQEAADYERRQAQDARDEAEAAERKLKQAQRGW